MDISLIMNYELGIEVVKSSKKQEVKVVANPINSSFLIQHS